MTTPDTTSDPTPEQLDATRRAMRQDAPTPEEIRAAWDALRRAMEPLVQMIEHTAAAAAKVAETFAEALAKAQTQADYALIPAGLDDADEPTVTLYVVVHGKFHPTGDLLGTLITHTGRKLYTHTSSSPAWLVADLTQNFGRADELAERFGDFRTVYVGPGDKIPDEIAPYINGPESERDA